VSTVEPVGALGPERRWVTIGIVLVSTLLVLQVAVGLVRHAISDRPSILEKVQTCLTERAVPFEPVLSDPVALSAGHGALRTTVEGNGVTVSLGRSESDAGRVYRDYMSVASADVLGTRLERDRRVVLLWDQEPTTLQRDFMHLCTLDAQP
jgi:hypothetical protein